MIPAPLAPPNTALYVGQRFSDWSAAKLAVTCDSHSQHNATVKASQSNTQLRVFDCYHRVDQGCKYRVYLKWDVVNCESVISTLELHKWTVSLLCRDGA